MKKLSAFSVNLTINLEPVYGIILAVIIFGDREKMQPGFYIGASVILLSVLGSSIA
jgi:drug/metabolite transporter (DMT)-like permease